MDFIKATPNGLSCKGEPILLRGFGLGGWFLPEGYMWKLYTKCDRPRRMEKMIEELCGKTYADYFWHQYFERYITEKDIELIAGEGFNSIRLPLNARLLCDRDNSELIFIKETIERIDQLIDWCKKYNIYVILDMHGASGGQTGQNIDDSENDEPGLFIEVKYQEELAAIWVKLAERYVNEEVVAGYDLINEPLPNWFSQYNHMVLPLYRKLIKEIRKVDQNHLIILEGVHWATDFCIFQEFTKEEAQDNIMLQFHKYWSNPDKESLESFTDTAKRLKVPLYMGEGGENNCEWYTTMFPLYERLNISWSFWSYKKMDCDNSPITFSVPAGWNELMDWIEGKKNLDTTRAKEIFNQFLACISLRKVNRNVFCALKRQVPVNIPCEAYDDFTIRSIRIPGVILRMTDPVTLLFKNGKSGEVDYKRYGGEEQPENETICIQLTAGDLVGYEFISKQPIVTAFVTASGCGTLRIQIDDEIIKYTVGICKTYTAIFRCDTDSKKKINLICEKGRIRLDRIKLE
ncbi:glycoside hydrolase family 5 protein [Anaerocolumna sp. MB42-C2]|uniref:glycoside hydrolase family 5 protein n=1 Tax=Anaerocolumna sp. MB42-C2 TaxID=3070997 RepID=UPI0027DFCEDB|nr:glycoside hydrolase family 5 protein [Anaerocolumna sp. MB42-C2]WMJ88372.1 glycoside hydrolase family 5 protein [Anaerocolumna sp. MB42-C2]